MGWYEERCSRFCGLLPMLPAGESKALETRWFVSDVTHSRVEMGRITIDFVTGLPHTSWFG